MTTLSDREPSAQANDPALRELVRIIVAELAPVAVRLFGGRAEGRARAPASHERAGWLLRHGAAETIVDHLRRAAALDTDAASPA